MTLLDRITLLRAGYSRKEIDQMIEEDKKQPEPEKPKEEPEQKTDPEPETDPEQKTDPEPEKKKEPEQDFKKLYEEQKRALEDLQEQNRRRDNSDKGKKSDADTLKDVVAGFF